MSPALLILAEVLRFASERATTKGPCLNLGEAIVGHVASRARDFTISQAGKILRRRDLAKSVSAALWSSCSFDYRSPLTLLEQIHGMKSMMKLIETAQGSVLATRLSTKKA